MCQCTDAATRAFAPHPVPDDARAASLAWREPHFLPAISAPTQYPRRVWSAETLLSQECPPRTRCAGLGDPRVRDGSGPILWGTPVAPAGSATGSSWDTTPGSAAIAGSILDRPVAASLSADDHAGSDPQWNGSRREATDHRLHYASPHSLCDEAATAARYYSTIPAAQALSVVVFQQPATRSMTGPVSRRKLCRSGVAQADFPIPRPSTCESMATVRRPSAHAALCSSPLAA
jgi:hypothetical protein